MSRSTQGAPSVGNGHLFISFSKEIRKDRADLHASPKFVMPRSIMTDPQDHIDIRILHSHSKAQKRETKVCRILMFLWSMGPEY